ncbi:MAG TPA: hypothetical protein VFB46_17615 [Gemmatimonadaceae bacterium]|nr:hypothetical protein [Gemmatimonadaceae bacterium]
MNRPVLTLTTLALATGAAFVSTIAFPTHDEFTFSFVDGARSGLIQTVAGSPRIGSGTVRVTPHDSGARFDVDGRTKQGVTIRATIDCPVFQKSEGGGG